MPTPMDVQRLTQVDAAFRSLPDRYLGAPRGFDATWHIRLGDIGRTWEVRCTRHGARVRQGVSRLDPDVVIGTDAATWLALRDGEVNGIEAFADRRLYARGALDLAVGFEGMFRLSGGRPPLLRIHDVDLYDGPSISTLTMGEGPDVLLIHGLGATKASFLDTAAAIARRGYRVHAIDLPGFGSSEKPLLAPYNAAWFSGIVLQLMDALGIERAHLVGNSMGGRIAIEVGLRSPARVASLTLLAPAVAFVKRDFWPLVKLLRPELGLLPHGFRRSMVAGQLWELFHDSDAIDPTIADVVVDEFQRVYASPAARAAFLTSARNIYLDRPFGDRGFYERLGALKPPALFVWGTHDVLIPAGFRRHVAKALPGAEQIVLQNCGHVPQVERPEQTNGMILRNLRRADAFSPPRAALHQVA